MRFSLALLLIFFTAAGAGAQLPSSSLSVDTGKGWKTWWRSDSATVKWDAPSPILSRALRWRRADRGVEFAELRLSGTGEAWRLRVIVVRVNPRMVTTSLTRMTREAGTLGAWSVDSAPPSATVALNAGQFASGRPWGWLVRDGVEEQSPGFGPLSLAFVIDSSGFTHLVMPDSIAAIRGRVRDAFQSYPTLLEADGSVPFALRALDRGADLEHRDSRLAIGTQRDGRIVIALTRFEGLGGVLSELPFGPTVPEMSALMGALGCVKAVSLDGGISGQMILRGPGVTRSWKGMRRVPLALVFSARR